MHKNNYMELTNVHMAQQARGSHAAELPKLCMDAKGMLKVLQQVGPAEKSILYSHAPGALTNTASLN